MKIGYEHLYRRNKEKEGSSIKDRFYGQFTEIIKFGFVGLSNTAVFWAVSISVTYLFYERYGKAYIIGNILAFLVSVAWSFFWNRRLVFKDKSRGWKLVLMIYKSYITYSFTGILLNNILSWIWIEKLGLKYTIAPILNSLIGFPINYMVSKKWTFVRGSER